MTDLLGGLIYAKRTPHMGVFLSLSDTNESVKVPGRVRRSCFHFSYPIRVIPLYIVSNELNPKSQNVTTAFYA